MRDQDLKTEGLTDQEKLQLGVRMATVEGFFRVYFEYLPKFETQQKCFNFVNDIYQEVFKSPKYANINSFRAVMYRDGYKQE